MTSDDDDVDADGSSNSRSHDFRLAFAGAPCPIVPHLHKSLHHETLFYTLLDEMYRDSYDLYCLPINSFGLKRCCVPSGVAESGVGHCLVVRGNFWFQWENGKPILSI